MIHPVPCCCDRAPEIVVGQRPRQVVYSTQSTTAINSGANFTVRFRHNDLTSTISGITGKLCVGSDNADSLYLVSGQSVLKYSSSNVLAWTYNAASSSWANEWLAVNADHEVWASHVNGTTLRLARIADDGSETWNTEHSDFGSSPSGATSFVAVDLSGNSVVCGYDVIGGTSSQGALLYHNSSGVLQWTILANELVNFDLPDPRIHVAWFGRPIFDSSGNVYAGLRFLTEASNGTTQQSVTYDTLFKFDSAGSTVWAKQLGVEIQDICFDSEENLYVAYENEDAGDGGNDGRLKRLSGADHDTEDWDVAQTHPASAANTVIAVSDFLYTFHNRGADVTSQRISKTDGSVLESVDMDSTFSNLGLCASPGLHPHFQ